MKRFEFQVAGHDQLKVLNDGLQIAKPCLEKERVFYSLAQATHASILPYIPRYDGSFEFEQLDYILLENLVANYTRPCIIDIKIGKRSYEENAEPAKMKSMMAKDWASTSHSLGVRLSGMKTWNFSAATYDTCDKKQAKIWSQTSSSFDASLALFFKPIIEASQSIRSLVFTAMSKTLDELIQVILSLEAQMYSCSLLMIYDAVCLDKWTFRLVDFAHSQWTPGRRINSDFVDGLWYLKGHIDAYCVKNTILSCE